jgi:6-phosphogluconolactonase
MIVHRYMMDAVMNRDRSTRRTLLRRSAAWPLVLARRSSGSAAKQYLVYWGTYTSSDPRFGTGESKGIYFSRFDSATGKLSTPELAVESENPSYLCVHPTRRYVYGVNEMDQSGGENGYVAAFSVNPGTGKLAPINQSGSHEGRNALSSQHR